MSCSPFTRTAKNHSPQHPCKDARLLRFSAAGDVQQFRPVSLGGALDLCVWRILVNVKTGFVVLLGELDGLQ